MAQVWWRIWRDKVSLVLIGILLGWLARLILNPVSPSNTGYHFTQPLPADATESQ